jgi:hypothetical protein
MPRSASVIQVEIGLRTGACEIDVSRPANDDVVPLAGLEPARCFHHLILSQARLPIPPQGQEIDSINKLHLRETKIRPLVTKMDTNRSFRNPPGYSRSERYVEPRCSISLHRVSDMRIQVHRRSDGRVP